MNLYSEKASSSVGEAEQAEQIDNESVSLNETTAGSENTEAIAPTEEVQERNI